VGGMAFDSKGSLWVSNSNVDKNLHELKPDGNWKAYTLPEISNQFLTSKVLITRNNDIWIIVPHFQTKGLYVMSNEGTNKIQLDVKSYFTNGEDEKITDMNDVYSIVEDKVGAIWVGTSTGIAVYSNPESVFEESPFYANQPGLDLNDGIYHALLENITVTALAVDGGNRKWCGTKSDGLFLISADGQHELEHFTTENSELISDNITSLAYDGMNGILYIGTQLGIVSYQTDSKDSYNKFDKVYAYPNPVRENYQGNIYITGLIYETNVKITTVSGRLVFETTSIGGQAVWDGNDLAGNRVHTGIYLAYCASSDGTQKAVAKILFIR
jgi:ligand-binding sensor domain-containing protein